MDWPSKNVAQGGVFQPARVNYSPQTKEFLQNLIRESKLTNEHRNKINYSLRTGAPLPPLNSKKKRNPYREEVIIRPGSSKRRSFQSIKESGAYEREKFKPLHPRLDRDEAKKELQEVMEHGKVVVPKPPKVEKKKKEEEKQINRYDELKLEIREREEWLKDMEELGEGEKHRWLINQQIQQRLREMEQLKVKD